MYKKTHNFDAYGISEEELHDLCKLPSAQMVINAVTQYNELVTYSGYRESKDVNALLIREAEEEEAKAFLDGIFDIVQYREE